MSEHTLDPPAAVVPQYAAFTMPAHSYEVSDLVGAHPQFPRGSRVIRLMAVLPPGILNESDLPEVVLPTGQSQNPLQGNVPMPPQLSILIDINALTPQARTQALHEQEGLAQTGPDQREVGTALPGLIGALLSKQQTGW